MRVVVVGATGNVGTSLVDLLTVDPRVDSIVGVARRLPQKPNDRVEFVAADIVRDDLVPTFHGADAVVHLAWVIQPSRNLNRLWVTNVVGSTRVFSAAAEAGVPALVYASSIGAYSPGPKDRAVGEDWPTDGIPTSFYSVHKVEVERRLDAFEREHPEVRVVRLRPALTFKHGAASGVRRLFAGPFLPSPLVRPGAIPVVPDIPGLRFQAVHSRDVAEAYRRALHSNARGAFNVAADPILDPAELARTFDARRVKMPARLARVAADATWRLRLQPTPPGWVDLALRCPLLDTTRARTELGWSPTRSATESLLELMEGVREGAGEETPPLDPDTSGPLRSQELATGIGEREGA
ncbi:MAG: NAD-dependent epimerase/dehydratase family protein [Actinomycetota bacterium]|nr:NAD-dependent epimerase/dehydratase family protein [Actinomycetota bacterium]